LNIKIEKRFANILYKTYCLTRDK